MTKRGEVRTAGFGPTAYSFVASEIPPELAKTIIYDFMRPDVEE